MEKQELYPGQAERGPISRETCLLLVVGIPPATQEDADRRAG